MASEKTEKGKNFVIENGIIKSTEPLPPVPEHNNYGETLLKCMKTNPTFVGQVDGVTGAKTTFAEMLEKSIKCAMWLKEQNIQPGDVIGICTHNQVNMYVPCFASLYVGAVYNPWWDISLTKDLAKYFIDVTKPKILFLNEDSAKIVREVMKEMHEEIKIVVFGSLPGLQSLDDILSSQDMKLVPEFRCSKLSSPNHPAVIMCTSGSTGLPKCALQSHYSLRNNVARFGDKAQKDATTSLLFSPLSWLSGVYCMLKEITIPQTRIIHPEFTEEICFQLIEKYKVSWMMMSTSTAYRLQKSPAIKNYDLSSLRFILLGGAAVKEETQKAVAEAFSHAFICQAYGSTELGGPGVEQSRNCKSGSCGTIGSNVSMKIIDLENGRILGPNQQGEACFKSPFMMNGYYRNPEETSKAIDSEGWLHTGDLLYYDEEGNIFYVDRIKELIKFRGNHISPAMIEQLLQGHPAVREVAVLPVPDNIDEEHPIAFVSKVPNTKVTEENLKKLVADTLPDYMKLRGGVRFLDELPHTTTGKVARMELKKIARSLSRSL